jgi:hypothetical protein
MSICDDILTSLREDASREWECRPIGSDEVLLSSPNQYADGDHVEFLVRRAGSDVIVTDAGEAMARLDTAGVSIESGRTREVWRSLIRAHELEEQNGRLFLYGSVADIVRLALNMANALANLDGLRLLVPPPKAPRFDEQLVTFLQSEFEFVDTHPRVTGKTGALLRPTAAAGNRLQPVYLQAVSGGNLQTRQRAVEHCLAIFFDINGHITPEHKLAVLGGGSGSWRPEHVRLLSSVAYVGSWNSRDKLVDFIERPIRRSDRVLLDREEQLTLQTASEDRTGS